MIKTKSSISQEKIKVTACANINCLHKKECIGKWHKIDQTIETYILKNGHKIYQIHFVALWKRLKSCCIWNSKDKKWSYELEENKSYWSRMKKLTGVFLVSHAKRPMYGSLFV